MTEAPWTEAEVADLRRLQAEGWTVPTIAGQVGRSIKSVRRKIERLRAEAVEAQPRRPWRACQVCAAPIEPAWWHDFRRCAEHRNARAA